MYCTVVQKREAAFEVKANIEIQGDLMSTCDLKPTLPKTDLTRSFFALSIAVQAFLELLGTKRFKFLATGFGEITKDVD